GLLLRSFLNAQREAPGIDAAGVASVQLWLPLPNDRTSGRYNDGANRAAFGAEVLRRARSVPGIASARLAGGPPRAAAAPRGRAPYPVPGRAPSGAAPLAVTDVVSDGYFETLGVPLLAGRNFDLRDVQGASPVAVINRTLAEHVFPGASP